MDTKSKNKFSPVMIWGLAFILAVIGLLSTLDVIRHRTYLHKDYYFKSEPYFEQLMLEWNLIQYIHIDYKNYPQWGPAAKSNTEYIRRLRNHYQTLISSKEQELNRLSDAAPVATQQTGTATGEPLTDLRKKLRTRSPS